MAFPVLSALAPGSSDGSAMSVVIHLFWEAYRISRLDNWPVVTLVCRKRHVHT